MMRVLFRDFRIIDGNSDFFGSVVVENGIITDIISDTVNTNGIGITVDGRCFGSGASNDAMVLMPAFIDLHAHFRDPGFPDKENLESASLAAVSGGFTTVVCMANTNPVIDTIEKARSLKIRSDALGLIDLYPVLSLTKNMAGKELSGIKDLSAADMSGSFRLPLLLSEDGKDVADDAVFLAAMQEAKRLGLPVSCHCDFGGQESEAAKAAGGSRAEWSRIEENNAVRRAIALGKKAGCHIHIAHVSTTEAAALIREAKNIENNINGFMLTCEATPHHIGATEADARRMGEERFGRVNPPLRTEDDRLAIIAAMQDGTIDAIATDHAPHTEADKAAGSPGFTGLETAFAVCLSNAVTNIDTCVTTNQHDLKRLSALMSSNPAQILGLRDRGSIAVGQRADMVIVDTEARWQVLPAQCKSRGICSPFAGRTLQGKICMTIHCGRIVFGG